MKLENSFLNFVLGCDIIVQFLYSKKLFVVMCFVFVLRQKNLQFSFHVCLTWEYCQSICPCLVLKQFLMPLRTSSKSCLDLDPLNFDNSLKHPMTLSTTLLHSPGLMIRLDLWQSTNPVGQQLAFLSAANNYVVQLWLKDTDQHFQQLLLLVFPIFSNEFLKS